MERHANKTNVLETIKVPLQRTTKSGMIIFAYLRRSTKKEEQRDSKQKQNDSVDLMAKDIGINIEDIQIFEDDFTGFKINTKNGKPQTKRKGYIALMEAIDQCKIPCILLAYDCSRLARNVPDGITICEKLGLYGNKQKIEYIRFYDGTKWDKTTRDKTINDAFSEANGYSEALSKQKQDKNITSLRRGIMPKTIKAPHGLRCTEKGLEETDTMQYIYRAFEMKVEGTLGKDISRYLISHGIPVSEGNLAFMVFQKTQYIGEYTHPKTGDVFEKLRFISGKTAIPQYLWDKVQARLGKKVGGYGEKQQGDIIAGLLRWEADKTKSFSLDIKTKPNGKQHKYYKSNSFDGVNIREKKIIEEFLREIKKLVILFIERGLVSFGNEKEAIMNSMENQEKEFEEWTKTLTEKEISTEEKENFRVTIEECRAIRKKIKEDIKNGRNIEKEISTEEKEKLRLDLYDSFSRELTENIQSIKNTNKETEKEMKEFEVKTLEKEKKQLEEQKKTITKNGLLGGYSKEEVNETIKDTEKEIQSIESQIEKLSESTDMDQFIERLPEVLNKTFELSQRVLTIEDNETMKKDIYKLLEICTFELLVNNKKELKIKLFEGLELGKISVVGDIGFEPMTPCV